MRRPFFVTLLTFLFVGWFGCAPAAQDQGQPRETGQSVESELFPNPPTPAANAVDIHVLCPPAQANGAAMRMIVNPPWKEVAHDSNGTVRWELHVSGNGALGARSLQPKNSETFPWEVVEDADGWTGEPNANYPTEPPSAGHLYSIRVTCNDDTIVWDPRMDIGL